MDLRDLSPQKDPKGGSPKTPFPIPAKQYYESVAQNHPHANGNGTIWKMAASGFAGLFVSMTVAWWTANQNRGVSQEDLQRYVTLTTAIITKDNSNQDRAIGELIGKQDRTNEALKTIGEKNIGYDNAITEINDKIKSFANYIEEQRKSKH